MINIKNRIDVQIMTAMATASMRVTMCVRIAMANRLTKATGKIIKTTIVANAPTLLPLICCYEASEFGYVSVCVTTIGLDIDRHRGLPDFCVD